ncbi:cytochrome b [Paraburkholderia fynbosensis]|uniref:Cytochrome b561 n=1 Tax=Paraburkholderia fynbosensis TaxID=1200993 RepID=A0A6J5FXG1_9BURK|nr:cytochrome b [Paraburkholderia fynbosensis]CAB3787385.1 Cytochrome b561 [Paraburkholderia fynbosensis]
MAKVFEMKRPAYDAVARMLHWLTVLLVATQFVIGWTMPDVHKDTQPVNLIAWHLGVGATLVAVMAIRVIWRLTHRPAPDELPPLLAVVSRITHVLLYAALVLVPLLGWINASSRGWSVRLLGVVPYPALSEPGSAFGHEMGDVHGILAWVLFALIGLHVVAALFHRFVLKDHVLQRMLPHTGPSRDRGRDR